jgi:hypothetical protein
MVRVALIAVGILAAVPALAGDMSAEDARRFVIGKFFSYTCFEGTRGNGRVMADGSVVGTIQFQGSGPVRYAAMPAGTLQVRGEAICAQVRGMPIQPCFNLTRTDANSFRGAISGLGFAYCDFTRHVPRPRVASVTEGSQAAEQVAEASQPTQPTRTSRPLRLKPSLAQNH